MLERRDMRPIRLLALPLLIPMVACATDPASPGTGTGDGDGKADSAVHQTRLLYAGADRMTATRLAVLNLPESNAMRAPGEATGLMALEIAMDEMAEKLGLDPIEFRVRNDTQTVPDAPAKPEGDDDTAQDGGNAPDGERRFSQRPPKAPSAS